MKHQAVWNVCLILLALASVMSGCAHQATGPTTIIITISPTGPTSTTPTLVLTTQIINYSMLQSYFSQMGLGRLGRTLINGNPYSTKGSAETIFSGFSLTKDKVIFFTADSIALYLVARKDVLIGLKCIDLSSGEIIGVYSAGIRSGDTTLWAPFSGSDISPGYYGLNVYADNILVAIYPFAMAIE